MKRGATVSLFPLARRHLKCTRDWANNPELMRLMNRTSLVSESEHQRWFESLSKQDDRRYFAIESNGDSKHVGNIWLWNIDQRNRKAELRVVIGEQLHQEKGFGSEAISLLCDYAFADLDLHKVYAFVLAINPRARRAFEKAGFCLEGTLRDDRRLDEGYTDVFLMGKVK